MTDKSEPACSIESGKFTLQSVTAATPFIRATAERCACYNSYLLMDQVVYLTICDASYPRKLAFSYLDELSKEFQRSYESQITSANRPYCFRGFGKFIFNQLLFIADILVT